MTYGIFYVISVPVITMLVIHCTLENLLDIVYNIFHLSYGAVYDTVNDGGNRFLNDIPLTLTAFLFNFSMHITAELQY